MPALGRAFYERHTLAVARDLVGKVLVVHRPGCARLAGRIVEVEAYRQGDPAAHSARGRTPRAAVLFGPAGVAYVYRIHQQHCLNLVTETDGVPGGVLIRGIVPLEGLAVMQTQRGPCKKPADLTNGPGKLCRALGITIRDNSTPLVGANIFVEDDGYTCAVATTRRIGISKGVELEWRFVEVPAAPAARVVSPARRPRASLAAPATAAAASLDADGGAGGDDVVAVNVAKKLKPFALRLGDCALSRDP